MDVNTVINETDRAETTNILPAADLGKRLPPNLAALSEWAWYAGLVVIAAGVFALVSSVEKQRAGQLRASLTR